MEYRNDDIKEMTRFPSHFIEPEAKDEKWCMEYAKAIYKEYRRFGSNLGFNARNRYMIARKYAKGKQSELQYRERLDMKDRNNESYVNLDWTVVPFLVKYVSIVVGKINERSYDVTCEPIDPLAIDAKKQYKARLEAQIRLQKFYDELAAVSGVQYGENSPDMPNDLEDLELYIQNNYKNQLGIDLEQAIKLVQERNDWEQIRKQIIQDWVEIGIGGCKVFIDTNGNPRIRYVEPEMLVMNYCKTESFSDLQYIGEVRYLTMQEIQNESGSKFTEDELKDMFRKAQYQFPKGGAVYDDLSFNYQNDDIRVEVLECEWLTINKQKFEKKTNAFGNDKLYKKNLGYQNKQGREVIDAGYKVAYKCSHIVGTDYSYNSGLKNDMIRTKSNPVETTVGYFLFSPNMQKGEYISTVEQLIPIADALQLAWLKMQDGIASAVKKGFSLDIDSLTEAAVDLGGGKMSAKEILDFYLKKGILVYSGKDMANNPNYKPINEMENGMAQDVMNFHQLLLGFLDLIRMISGINEVTDASTPSPEMLVGNAQMAYQATNLALIHLFHAEEKLLKNMIPAIAELIMDAEKNYGTVFKEALGENTQDFIAENSNKSIHEYGYIIERMPDEQEKQVLEMMASRSLESREIELEDYWMIRRLGKRSPKQAENLLVLRKKKRMKDAQAMAEQQMQQNAQVQQQSAQQASEMEMQRLQQEGQMEMQKIQMTFQLEMQKMKLEYELKERLLRIEGNVKEEVAHIQNEGKLAATEMQHETSMMTAKMNKDKPKINAK
jgi:hypothetical protein